MPPMSLKCSLRYGEMSTASEGHQAVLDFLYNHTVLKTDMTDFNLCQRTLPLYSYEHFAITLCRTCVLVQYKAPTCFRAAEKVQHLHGLSPAFL